MFASASKLPALLLPLRDLVIDQYDLNLFEKFHIKHIYSKLLVLVGITLFISWSALKRLIFAIFCHIFIALKLYKNIRPLSGRIPEKIYSNKYLEAYITCFKNQIYSKNY